MKNKSKLKLALLISVLILIAATFILLRWTNAGTNWLWQLSNGGAWLLPLLAAAAIIDSINPCAFSILILTIAFLFTIGKIRSKIIGIGSAYIAGIFVVYVLIGLGILQTLHIFNTPHFMAKVGASLLIIWGVINIVNELFPSFPIKLRIPQIAHQRMAGLMEKSSLPTAFILGILVGICEFPCTGGPYLMALGLLHDQATYATGFGYLLLYNAIFVLPLVIILLIASHEKLLAKVQAWKNKETRKMRWWGGIAMIILGLIIFII
ncbi:MAG: cytochrome c biogenesis protein CcdA [bacterium]|nr:cytochrome c biogenesis protein CcdA [bacterium]